MCTLAIFRDVSQRLPLVVAANRDEFLARPTDGPAALPDVPGVVAGRDLEAGGTWLGARSEGGPLVAGLLNRRVAGEAVAEACGERSRGLLCLDALRSDGVARALARVHAGHAAGPSLEEYCRFNLLLADLGRALVVDNSEGVRVTELERGLSVLTNLDVNDPRCPRLASAVPRFEEVERALTRDPSPEQLPDLLRPVLSNHESSLDPSGRSELSRLCIHAGTYGTRSSTIVAYEADGSLHYFHAPSAPCMATYERIAV